jgi:hypothetical protein
MEHFEESAAGRLLTLAVVVPLAVGAGATWDGGGAGSVAIMGSIAVGAILATVGGGLALDERAKYTIGAMLLFPPALLLYFPLLALASYLPVVRAAMALAAIGLLGLLLKGAVTRTPSAATPPPRRVVHRLA